MTEAIVTEGTEKGELRKICADAECPVHHPKKQQPAGEERIKAEQEKQRREKALANAVGLRVLSAITAAVPIRLRWHITSSVLRYWVYQTLSCCAVVQVQIWSTDGWCRVSQICPENEPWVVDSGLKFAGLGI